MNIRRYTPADRMAVVELWELAFGDGGDHNSPERSLDRKLEFGDGLLFVATNEYGIAGAVMGGYDGHRGWVYALAVYPIHRRKGIGTQLVRHLETCLQEMGCPKLNLQIRSSNSDVQSFYERLGFLTEDRISMGKCIGTSHPPNGSHASP